MFDWFTRKKPASAQSMAEAESSGLAHVDATQPFSSLQLARARNGATPGSAANRKTERLERREQLYAIVRESMTRAGVLSSSYKFKVLSLDSRGHQYLIMMDLPRQHTAETARLAEIEGLIAKSAKTRHDIIVTAVYWRVNEHVTAGLSRARVAMPAPAGPAPAAANPVPRAPATPAAAAARPQTDIAPVKPRFDPLQADEVAAFKRALASVPVPPRATALGELQKTKRRNPEPEAVPFRDTVMDDSPSPLSGTQYGDLN